jgi:hypothetical protein
MARVETADSAGEIEEYVAVDIDQVSAIGALEENAVWCFGDTTRDMAPAQVEECSAARTRQRRPNPYTGLRLQRFRSAHVHSHVRPA